ncbi:MAG: 8-amino-7-oxononanoate synthase [Candidatus Binataceae bacterium]
MRMGILDEEFRAALDGLERDSLRRRLRIAGGAHGPRVEIDGRQCLMLSSNNYLGLAAHPALKRAAIEAIERYGVGAGASRLIAGSLAPLHELEARIARFKRVEAALVFGSGYLANLGAISAIVGSGDEIFSDELNHASLIDGCRLSRAAVRIYRHRDMEHLGALLKESQGAHRRLIVTDSVFSMDGDVAPLAEIVELARKYRAAVTIDEAHAVGVVGPNGAGLVAKLGLEREVDIHVGTLSKALGAYGAYVAGSRALVDILINRARSFIFSTGLPPAMAAAARAALDLIEAEPALIERLWNNAEYLRGELIASGFTIAPTETPIIPVMIGESAAALAMSAALLKRGVYVIAIRPPTVPKGTARLRVTPIASHSRADLDEAIAAFVAAGREVGSIAKP